MEQVVGQEEMAADEDRRISETIGREQSRLRNFIRSRVLNSGDAEDILQDVFYELVEAYRLMKPIEQVGAWLFRVARNKIIDVRRKKQPEALAEQQTNPGEGDEFTLETILPSKDAGPDAAFARTVFLKDLEDALDELPQEQREAFIAHEIEGRSFKDMAAQTGLSINTLLSRKRYAVLHLRERLRGYYK